MARALDLPQDVGRDRRRRRPRRAGRRRRPAHRRHRADARRQADRERPAARRQPVPPRRRRRGAARRAARRPARCSCRWPWPSAQDDPLRFAEMVSRDQHLIPRLGVLALTLTDALREAIGAGPNVTGALVAARAGESAGGVRHPARRSRGVGQPRRGARPRRLPSDHRQAAGQRAVRAAGAAPGPVPVPGVRARVARSDAGGPGHAGAPPGRTARPWRPPTTAPTRPAGRCRARRSPRPSRSRSTSASTTRPRPGRRAVEAFIASAARRRPARWPAPVATATPTPGTTSCSPTGRSSIAPRGPSPATAGRELADSALRRALRPGRGRRRAPVAAALLPGAEPARHVAAQRAGTAARGRDPGRRGGSDRSTIPTQDVPEPAAAAPALEPDAAARMRVAAGCLSAAIEQLDAPSGCASPTTTCTA